jgi:hypothetical protein
LLFRTFDPQQQERIYLFLANVYIPQETKRIKEDGVVLLVPEALIPQIRATFHL